MDPFDIFERMFGGTNPFGSFGGMGGGGGGMEFGFGGPSGFSGFGGGGGRRQGPSVEVCVELAPLAVSPSLTHTHTNPHVGSSLVL